MDKKCTKKGRSFELFYGQKIGISEQCAKVLINIFSPGETSRSSSKTMTYLASG